MDDTQISLFDGQRPEVRPPTLEEFAGEFSYFSMKLPINQKTLAMWIAKYGEEAVRRAFENRHSGPSLERLSVSALSLAVGVATVCAG
jgi:hypothetical protein